MPLAGGDRQEVLGGVEFGVADVQEFAPGQGPGEELEVVQVAGHLGRVPVERQVADRHPAVPGDVEPQLDLLDVLAAALGPPVGGLGHRRGLTLDLLGPRTTRRWSGRSGPG